MILCNWHEKWCHPERRHSYCCIEWMLLREHLPLLTGDLVVERGAARGHRYRFFHRPLPFVIIKMYFRSMILVNAMTKTKRKFLHLGGCLCCGITESIFNRILRYIILRVYVQLPSTYFFANLLAHMEIECRRETAKEKKGLMPSQDIDLIFASSRNKYLSLENRCLRLETSSLIAHHSRAINVGERWKRRSEIKLHKEKAKARGGWRMQIE